MLLAYDIINSVNNNGEKARERKSVGEGQGTNDGGA
jgi:hypothetical protein